MEIVERSVVVSTLGEDVREVLVPNNDLISDWAEVYGSETIFWMGDLYNSVWCDITCIGSCDVYIGDVALTGQEHD